MEAKLYLYDGPFRDENGYGRNVKIQTRGHSREKAKSNIIFRIKKSDRRLFMGSKIKIEETLIQEVV